MTWLTLLCRLCFKCFPYQSVLKLRFRQPSLALTNIILRLLKLVDISCIWCIYFVYASDHFRWVHIIWSRYRSTPWVKYLITSWALLSFTQVELKYFRVFITNFSIVAWSASTSSFSIGNMNSFTIGNCGANTILSFSFLRAKL